MKIEAKSRLQAKKSGAELSKILTSLLKDPKVKALGLSIDQGSVPVLESDDFPSAKLPALGKSLARLGWSKTFKPATAGKGKTHTLGFAREDGQNSLIVTFDGVAVSITVENH